MKKLLVIIAVLGVAAFSVNSASANVGLRAVGLDAGYISPENIDGTWTLGMYMDFGIPVTNMYVTPFVNYWGKSIDEPITSSSVDFSDVQIGGALKYVIPTSAANVQPFVGAGVAAHMLKSEMSNVPLLGSVSATDTKIGYHFGGGVRVGVNERVSVVGQTWYTLVEDFNMWSMRGGLAFTL